MREQLQRRLEELKKEFTAGRARVAELEQQQTTLHQTLLRISGAIQVLEEELKSSSTQDDAPSASPARVDSNQSNGDRAQVRA